MSDLDVPAGLLACTSPHGLENALCDTESAIGEPAVGLAKIMHPASGNEYTD